MLEDDVLYLWYAPISIASSLLVRFKLTNQITLKHVFFFYRIIQNYIIFHVANGYSDLLTEDFILLSKNLSIAKYGVFKETPRWKRCVSATDSAIGMALGAMYVRNKFATNSNEEVMLVIIIKLHLQSTL